MPLMFVGPIMTIGTFHSSRHRGHPEVGPARHWRYLVNRHGKNLLGGLMVMVMLGGAVLAVLGKLVG